MDTPEFGVNVSNAFYLLDDEAPAPVKKKEPKVEPVVQPKKFEKPSREEKPRGKGGRGGRDDRGKGRGKGKGKGKGDRPPRDGKREHDRSHGDRGPKKGGAGKYNWGADSEQVADGEHAERGARRERGDRGDRGDRPRRNNRDKPAPAAATDAEEKPADEAPAEGEEKPAEVEKPAEPEAEPEPAVIGYDEYLAKKAESALEEDKRVARVVEIDDSQWKSGKVPTKEEDPEDTYATDGAKKGRKKKNRNKKAVVHLDEFSKEAKSSSKGGKGKGGKGGKGKGGKGKGGRGQKFPVSLGEDQFPTLGGK